MEVPVVLPSAARRHHRPGNGRRRQAVWTPGRPSEGEGGDAPRQPYGGEGKGPCGVDASTSGGGCHGALWTQCPLGVQRGARP